MYNTTKLFFSIYFPQILRETRLAITRNCSWSCAEEVTKEPGRLTCYHDDWICDVIILIMLVYQYVTDNLTSVMLTNTVISLHSFKFTAKIAFRLCLRDIIIIVQFNICYILLSNQTMHDIWRIYILYSVFSTWCQTLLSFASKKYNLFFIAEIWNALDVWVSWSTEIYAIVYI